MYGTVPTVTVDMWWLIAVVAVMFGRAVPHQSFIPETAVNSV